ncbi:MAG: biopolymer transport protein ExbB [Bacillota bacterium]|nr:MotA/TolQ/ExbB proton channel family protein [Bacillota bacterium]MDI6638621.1 MotA/TolQ/ExbB proton channel family protein [Bacillota bacterium]MDK2930159.1 biopolymer transport protein ExbB [Bacillota bacterium]
MVDVLIKGGPVMIPLLLCSVLALAVAFERILYMLRTSQDPERALRLISVAIDRDRMAEAVAAVQQLRGQIGALATAALTNSNRPRAELEAEVKAVGEREAFLLESHLPVLDMIVTVAPLLGLLGTVLGLIKNFQILAQTPQVLEAGALSAGIAEALITTAAGLIIAVPAFILHVYITGLIDKRLVEMSEFGSSLVNLLSERVSEGELSQKQPQKASS